MIAKSIDARASVRRLVAGFAMLCAAALAAAPAVALEFSEDFDGVSDPSRVLGGSLLIGDDGKWVGALDEGSYMLTNSAAVGAVRYSHLGPSDGSTPTAVSIDVSGSFDGEAAGAGLLYRYDGATKGYFAFVLTADGYALYKRTARGFQPLSRGRNDAVKSGGPNTLTVQLDGASATLLVNGQRVLGHKSEGPPAGAEVGLIAIDRGVYRFDNFALSSN